MPANPAQILAAAQRVIKELGEEALMKGAMKPVAETVVPWGKKTIGRGAKRMLTESAHLETTVEGGVARDKLMTGMGKWKSAAKLHTGEILPVETDNELAQMMTQLGANNIEEAMPKIAEAGYLVNGEYITPAEFEWIKSLFPDGPMKIKRVPGARGKFESSR